MQAWWEFQIKKSLLASKRVELVLTLILHALN